MLEYIANEVKLFVRLYLVDLHIKRTLLISSSSKCESGVQAEDSMITGIHGELLERGEIQLSELTTGGETSKLIR